MSTNSFMSADPPTREIDETRPAKRQRLQRDEPGVEPDESGAEAELEPVRSFAEAVSHTAELLELSPARSYKELLFSALPDKPMTRKLRAFVDSSVPLTVDESRLPVTSWHGKTDRTDWDVHCPDVHSAWTDFVKDVQHITDGSVDISAMSAPSGPLRSKATFLWHYPTTTSASGAWSHTLDPGSNTVMTQRSKIGLPNDVRTQNIIPFRLRADFAKTSEQRNGPEWSEYVKNWSKAEELCCDLQCKLSQNDRYIFTVGAFAYATLLQFWEKKGRKVQHINLQLDLKMFNRKPRITVVLDDNQNIVQVIIPVFHGQFSFNNFRLKTGALWDLLFNAGCEIANIPVNTPELFTRMTRRDKRKSALLDFDNPRPSFRVALIMREDFKTGYITPSHLIIPAFAHILKSLPELEAKMIECEKLGHPPIAVLSDHYSTIAGKTRSENARKAKAAANAGASVEGAEAKEAGEPKPKRCFKDRKSTPQFQRVISKYNALMATHEAVTALALRNSPDRTHRQALAVRRLDRLTKLREVYEEQTDDTKFPRLLGSLASFASKSIPDGLRWETEDDRYPNGNHPWVYLLRSAMGRVKNKRFEQANATAGENDDESDDDDDDDDLIPVGA
ncbi:hypothetical protein PWT90_10991 [Aphanocladium album]|nr:hypothetical protein PWT90_10991 [Aphanocladium album]